MKLTHSLIRCGAGHVQSQQALVEANLTGQMIVLENIQTQKHQSFRSRPGTPAETYWVREARSPLRLWFSICHQIQRSPRTSTEAGGGFNSSMAIHRNDCMVDGQHDIPIEAHSHGHSLFEAPWSASEAKYSELTDPKRPAAPREQTSPVSQVMGALDAMIHSRLEMSAGEKPGPYID